MKLPRLFLLAALLSLVLSACAPAATPATTPAAAQTAEPVTLTVMTHDSFAVTEDLVRQFEQENNVKVEFAKSGDTGSALNMAILSKDAPRADVFYGVDNTFLSRALEAGIFEPYASPLLADIPAEFKLDATNSALPVDYGDVCINYDKAYFADKGLALPATLDDLLKPEYKGLLVTENPATSSPGLAFIMATIVQYGPDKYLDFWKGLKENGLVVVNDWETAYYTNFSGSSGKGSQPMVVSYGSSPAAEVVYADPPVQTAPTASIVGDNTCFRQIEFVGILKGTQHRALAEKFVDFMLGTKFQEDMPLQMFVFPVNSQAKLPDVFTQNIQIPAKPATIDPSEIGANREAWINAWTETILK
ncbi:ABC transporter periplasmic binding protein, thiB subfamily [Longilinea arvoryzae]|uniref:ABC transporter periplasmic binding protein, thiB subfamily n=1 Tax=Longilinea arvoryzae TaxID=360412 RepID=A0A0S7BHT4_9CHLR|nr:thiamine ABC transporter substrate-binding protein [Longilinea arvoryzae]GAP13816.1 ABC transporter periplasmic binding protein, thiB subfamily [Longilinea arvoryzae]